MIHKEPAFIRKGNKIKDVALDIIQTYPSIGAAKRASHILQQANGGRGQGYVRVEHKGKVNA